MFAVTRWSHTIQTFYDIELLLSDRSETPNKNAFQQDAYRPLQWPTGERGASAQGDVSACTGYRGVSAPVHAGIQSRPPPPPHVNRITDACENIILPLIKCIFGDIIFAPCVPAPYPLLTLACCTCYLEHFLFSIESSLVSFVALVSNYEFRTINDMYFNLQETKLQKRLFAQAACEISRWLLGLVDHGI